MSVVNIGSLNVDYVYLVDTFLQPGETKASRSLHINAGGKGLNQSIAFSKAGSKVYHAGIYGAGGEFLKQTLEENGIDTHLMQHRPDLQNGHAIIQVADSGQNNILLYGGTNQAFTDAYIQEILAFCSEEDLIILQNEINGIDKIISAAYDRHIPVAMNVSPLGKEVGTYPISKLRWIVVNEIEGRELAGGSTPHETAALLVQKYPDCNILMTLGADGAWLHCGSTELCMGALPVCRIVDTTAAGDTFLGYFFSGILSGESPETTLEQATCASALTIQKAGAAQSIPSREEVLQYWLENRSKLSRRYEML